MWKRERWQLEETNHCCITLLFLDNSCKLRCWGNAKGIWLVLLRGKLKPRKKRHVYFVRSVDAATHHPTPPPLLAGAPCVCFEGNTCCYFQSLCFWWSKFQPSAPKVQQAQTIVIFHVPGHKPRCEHLSQIRPTWAVDLEGSIGATWWLAFPFNSSLNITLRK